MDTEKISNLRKNLVLLSMGELICGLFMTIFNNESIGIVIQMFGIIAASYGIITFMTWLFKKDKSGAVTAVILLAACLIAGLCLIFLKDQIKGIFSIVMGLILVVFGIFKFPNIFDIKKAGYKKWAFGLIPAAVIIALGAVIIVMYFTGPKLADPVISIMMGIGFIIGCVGDVMTLAAASTIEYALKNGGVVDAEQDKLEDKGE